MQMSYLYPSVLVFPFKTFSKLAKNAEKNQEKNVWEKTVITRTKPYFILFLLQYQWVEKGIAQHITRPAW